MSLQINCDICEKPLEEPGALVFSPPNGTVVSKYHVCIKCFKEKFQWTNGLLKDITKGKANILDR